MSKEQNNWRLFFAFSIRRVLRRSATAGESVGIPPVAACHLARVVSDAQPAGGVYR